MMRATSGWRTTSCAPNCVKAMPRTPARVPRAPVSPPFPTPPEKEMFPPRDGFGAKGGGHGGDTHERFRGRRKNRAVRGRGKKCGLSEARRIVAGVRGIAFTQFGAQDVVRHPLVARIIDAYEKHPQEE